MTEKINDGGPAFPQMEEYEKFDDASGNYVKDIAPNGGMTLRDYFAAKAMVGILFEESKTDSKNAKIAQWAYAMADAMLAERQRP